jgi:heme-degrading monooxygenase HmoA
MFELKEIDPSCTFFSQVDSAGEGPVTVINTLVTPQGRLQAAVDDWRKNVSAMQAMPGFVSAQLYRGVGDSQVMTNVAVWASAADLKNALEREFRETADAPRDGTLAYPVLVRKEAVPGVCEG